MTSTAEHGFAVSPHGLARGIDLFSALSMKGRGECRALDAPAASHAVLKKHASVVTTGHTGITRHSPRNGCNGYCALSLVRRAFWPPSPALRLADLTPASGCQDHTPSPSASSALVRSTVSVHHIPPRVHDDRETPLSVGRDTKRLRLIGVDCKHYLRKLENNF